MVHEYSHTTPAVKGILSFATFSERKHMLKTLKRKIALVAVAAVGVGMLSAIPANAAITATAFSLADTGVTSAADVVATAVATTPTAFTRAGATLTFKGVTLTGKAGTTSVYKLVLNTAADGSGVETALPTSIHALGAGVAFSVGVTGTFTATAAMNNQFLMLRYDDAADGTFEAVIADPFTIKLDVIDAGTPASLSWAGSTREVSGTAVDYTVVATPKDSNGVSTRLLDTETYVVDVTPQNNATAATAIDVNIANAVMDEADGVDTAGATAYSVVFDGNGSENGTTGATISGVTYTLTGQLVKAGNAVGAPASATYTRISNTAGLTGTLSFTSDTAGTALTSLSTAPNVATTGYFVKAVDAAGANIKGVTIALALSGVTGATEVTSDTTAQTGFTSSRTATPTAAGTGVITASINAGATTISKTLAITSVGFGAIAPLAAGVTATAVNGNGLIAGATAGTTWTASRSTTSITLKISGLTASKTARVEPAGTAIGVKAAGVTRDGTTLNDVTVGFLTADAAGVLTIPVTLTSATTGQTALIRVDSDAGDALVALDITITFTDAAAALTTVPASATTSFVAVSSSQTITASIADQYANPVVGGSVLLTNTSAPSLVTLATAVAVNVSNTGTATLTAAIASTIGNYVFTVQARDANGANVGTLSTITYTATADGAPGSVTLTSGGSEAALGSFTVWTSTNGTVPASATIAQGQTANNTADASLSTDTAAEALAKVGDLVVITVKVANAAGTGIDNVKVGAVGSAGVFLATTIPGASAKLSTMISTSATSTGGGVATIHAVATKVGTNTVTFTVGSKTATATFISKQGLTARSIARTVTLGGATVAVTGGAITQAVATVKDAFGNPVAGVALTGTISGVAGRFAGGARSFAASTDAAGTVTFEITGNVTESGAGLLTVAGTDAATNITTADFLTGDLSGNLSTLGILQSSSTTATLAVAAGVADSSSAQIKTDVATANAAVKALATQVTVLQASVATLIDSLTTQIATLLKSVSALTKAVAKLQAKKK